MSEAQAAATGAEAENTEVVEAEATATPQDAFEAVAREGGWLPKEEFAGRPDAWLEPKDFVLNAAKILPHLTRDLREARGEIKEMKRDFKAFGKFHTEAVQREHARALREIEERLDQAHASNDLQGVHDAADDLAELKAAAAAQPAKSEEQAKSDAVFEEWAEKNKWYGSDEEMTREANIIGAGLFSAGVTGEKQVAEVDRRIRKMFPERFKNPNRDQAAAVESGGTAPRKTGKTRSDLPPNARETMDRWVKQGLVTEAQYLKDYQW